MRNWKRNALLAVAVALAGCNGTGVEEPATYDIHLAVECTTCNSHPRNANLRVSLYPDSALVGDILRGDGLLDTREWRYVGTGTDTTDADDPVFRDIKVGDYLITAASPYAVELGGTCTVDAPDTARNAGSWPYVLVTVEDGMEPVTGIHLSC